MNSELRQDLVSGDWIVIAPGRAKRPRQLLEKVTPRKVAPVKDCPFENPQKHGHEVPILIYPNLKNWDIQVVQNKYPALSHEEPSCSVARKVGPYATFSGVGHHDLVITRNHRNDFSALSSEQANLVFQTFRDRYLMLHNDQCVDYIAVFHNWGPGSGASVFHPHYQILAIPVVPPDVHHSLSGSARYFKEHKKCIHCVTIEWEKKEKKRVIFENEGAIAFAPFVSRAAFEVRIFPKKHLPYFENTYDQDLENVVEALQAVLKKFIKNLKDPDYNFFIHTAPLRNKNHYGHYHWHIEVLPKIAMYAGFELSTGVEINIVDPDEAAKILKK